MLLIQSIQTAVLHLFYLISLSSTCISVFNGITEKKEKSFKLLWKVWV